MTASKKPFSLPRAAAIKGRGAQKHLPAISISNLDTTRREFLAIMSGAAAGLVLSSHWRTVSAQEIAKGKLLHRIDCTQELPPERYFALGEVKVVDSPIGRYREALGNPPTARFGYRFSIENIGQPHVAVIRYPDDKRRYMCINDGTCYDLTTGVFTGWAQPISNTMLELRQVFWPRWNDCAIVFMTWGAGEPAAVASIDIYELTDLPPAKVPGDPGDGTRRELGIQYEDPCGTGGSEGAMFRDEWIDRLAQYARHSGQNLLIYPIAWYHGPLFPSKREPSGAFDWVVARDRKQYTRWTTTPTDWYAKLLERLGQEGLEFQGAMTLMRLGSLLEKMNINLDAIKGGAETYNNMLWNNCVQSSTNDWTPIYNARNYKTLTADNQNKKPLEPWAQNPSRLAYGEVGNPGHAGPMFNPLHPTVQEAIVGLAREIGQHYAKYPAFKGISFNMFASAMPWFGSIHSGYDDYTVGLFQKETGIDVPVDPKAPDRFSRRYEFLTFVCRSAWVDWRCGKIRDLFGRIRLALAEGRADLRVTVTLWDETFVNFTRGPMPALQLDARPSMLELYRDAGIDIELYGNEPGLEIDRGTTEARDRGGHSNDGAGAPLATQTMYRDFAFLDQRAIDAFARLDRPGAFLFNCWVEAWGDMRWFRPADNDQNLPAVAVMDGRPAEGIFGMNSAYPKDGFWWDSQLRITPGFQAGVHFLEPYAAAVADLDACRITRGGLFLDKAHTDQLQQFARAYRALPKHKFTTVGPSTDPVAVRTLARDGRRYVYAVNRDYYSIKLEMAFSGKPTAAKDLATGLGLDIPQRWSFVLGPYELRSLAVAPDVEIAGFTATLPEPIVTQLRTEAERTLVAIAKARTSANRIPGMDELEQRIRNALAAGQLAWLRRALTSYLARKCRALVT